MWCYASTWLAYIHHVFDCKMHRVITHSPVGVCVGVGLAVSLMHASWRVTVFLLHILPFYGHLPGAYNPFTVED